MILFSLEVWLLRGYALLLKWAAKVLPVRMPLVFVGAGSRRQLCAAIADSDFRRVLIVTDATIRELGLLDPMIDVLESRSVSVAIYDGIRPDPSIEEIDEGFRHLQRHQADAVLAVGGGSPIDGAKVIAALATNHKPIRKMAGLFKVRKPLLPLYAIPTTAGTGSEVSVGAVVTDQSSRRKLVLADLTLLPRMTCLDPEIQLGVPPSVTADTGMDALTHAVEAYLSRIHTPASDEKALAAVRLIMHNLPKVFRDGHDLEARQNMALAAHYAGMAMSQAGLGYVHAIAHNFGAHYHVPHGRANAMVLPYVLEYSRPACIERLANLARAAGLGTMATADTELAVLFIEHVQAMNKVFGIPAKLSSLRKEDIPQITRAAMKEARSTYAVPRYMCSRRCAELVAEMIVSDQ